MDNFDPTKQKLFLLSQRIAALAEDLSADEIARQVGGSIFGEAAPDESVASRGAAWTDISRDDLLLRASGRDPAGLKPHARVALVCDAGLGKTTNLEWLNAHIGEQSRQIPLLVHLDNPAGRELLRRERDLAAGRSAGMGDALLRSLAQAVHDVRFPSTSKRRGRTREFDRIMSALRRAQADQRITLILDGLDHALGKTLAVSWIQGLLKSAQWSGCPVWIAGRPYAFGQCWSELFQDEPWQFLRIEPLTELQIRHYLRVMAGGDWFDDVPRAGRRLLATPRFLRIIADLFRRTVPFQVAQGRTVREAIEGLRLHTAADVYHRAYFDETQYRDVNRRCLLGQGLVGKAEKIGLKKGVPADETNYGDRIHRMGVLLGALAFEIASRTPPASETKHLCDGVVGEELRSVKTDVASRVRKAGLGTEEEFDRDFAWLTKLGNKTVDFLLFREANAKGLVWHDRTVQAFFAAHWALKYGKKTEDSRMQSWIVGKGDERLPAFDEFWQFAAEMPDALIDFERWKATFAPCFTPPPKLTGGAEWVQWHRRMVYFSFERMRQRAIATLTDWRAKTADQQAIAAEIEAGFQRIIAGSCQMGADPIGVREWDEPPSAGMEKHVAQDFLLHQWPTTNWMYEAFDPAHGKNRWYGEPHPLAKKKGKAGETYCPVVNVSFYDAWNFAKWLGDHVFLPSELQWEHACRAGTATKFYFGNLDSELEKHAWYLKNSGDHTHPVPTDGSDFHRNANLLYDMHGNVWEWCESLYEPGASSRVLRGGSWRSIARDCRSALRFRSGPDDRVHYIGFRLAAVPALEPRQASQE